VNVRGYLSLGTEWCCSTSYQPDGPKDAVILDDAHADLLLDLARVPHVIDDED
jgi:hypothetical protein